MFTRALNARSIMSNVIPNLDSQNDTPYCIWHPETASDETYRELALRFPHLAYNVGRACAVAGYTTLFHELDILPDVHIAEEARECGNLAIYEAIMSQVVRYNIMNDYTLSVDRENRQPACLNGDTCVRWMLDVKQKFKNATDIPDDDDEWDLFAESGYEDTTFNITEDMHIDEYESSQNDKRELATRPELRLLCEPLPADLSTVQKDMLILMAAYHGDVDRYARLRRPKQIRSELQCCVRGIYHNTFFAVWWFKQPGQTPSRIQPAINARYIMNNVLAGAPYPKGDIPYLIWWPTKAQPSTYRHLAQIQPEMLPQIIRACIYCGYQDLFDELLPRVTPDEILVREVEEQGNLHFREALRDRVQSLGITPQEPPVGQAWKMNISSVFGQSSTYISKYLDVKNVGIDFDVPYDGWQCDATDVETNACLPDAWRIPVEDESTARDVDYEE